MTFNNQAEMASVEPLKDPIYTYNTEHKICRIAKMIFSIIFFPIILGLYLHKWIGKQVLPSTSTPSETVSQFRKAQEQKGWKVKRITVEVDGMQIDGAIIGKKSTLKNRRWVLAANGNVNFYEEHLGKNSELKNLLNEVNGNAVVFNYPGVGANKKSEATRETMKKAYLAMLNFLEDQEKGIGAKEIIGFGYSMGGAVQAEALSNHKLKEKIKYVFVSHLTFFDSSSFLAAKGSTLLSWAIKPFYWNIGYKKINAPEIITQHADVKEATDIKDAPYRIRDDDAVPAPASLAKRLIKRTSSKDNRYFMGVPERHFEPLSQKSLNHLGKKIIEMLA